MQGLAIAASCSSANSFRLGRRLLSLLVPHLNRARVLRVSVLAFVLLSFGAHVALAATAGSVSRVENQAQVGATPAAVGTPVQTNDELRTGPKARLEVTFTDGTKLTLGENAKVVVDRYVFNPDKSVGELALSTSAAAFRLATGKLSEMQDRKVTVATPFAALAVRGTDFWGGPIDGQYGVLLVSNSRVDVSGKTRSATKSKTGTTTTRKDADAALSSISRERAPISDVRSARELPICGLRERSQPHYRQRASDWHWDQGNSCPRSAPPECWAASSEAPPVIMTQTRPKNRPSQTWSPPSDDGGNGNGNGNGERWRRWAALAASNRSLVTNRELRRM